MTLVAGRRAAEDPESRVGGLLSPVPGAPRDCGGLDVEGALTFDGVVRFVVAEKRFGGMPFLGGDLSTILGGLGCRVGVSGPAADWYVCNGSLNPISCGCASEEERDSAESLWAVEAMTVGFQR